MKITLENATIARRFFILILLLATLFLPFKVQSKLFTNTVSWENIVIEPFPLTFFAIANGDRFQNGGGTGGESTGQMSVEGYFLIKAIDPAKFTITNATFKLTGFTGGYTWCSSGRDILGDADISTEVHVGPTNMDFGSGGWFYSPKDSPLSGVAYGHWSVKNYSDIVSVPLPLANYYIGSPLEQNGFIKFRVNARVYTYGYEMGDYADTTYAPAPGIMGFAGYGLQAIFDVVTNAPNVSYTDLPQAVNVSPKLKYNINYGGGGPIPPNDIVPAEIMNEVALHIESPKVVGKDIQFTLRAIAGTTNFVQVSSSLIGSSFADISGPIVPLGTNMVSTNFVDAGGVTNGSTRYYRIRCVQ